MIIAFLNQKGGVGKSTAAMNAADWIHREGHSVLLIDADPQGTTSDWAALREELPWPVMKLTRQNMAKEIMHHGENYDYVVIDGPPRAEALSRAIIIASDMVVLPIEPSGASDWASKTTIEQVREALEYKETLKSVFLVSRMISGTVISREIRDHVAEHEIPILPHGVTNRVQFAEAMTLGKTIFEYAPKSEAAKEISTIMKDIGEFYHGEND